MIIGGLILIIILVMVGYSQGTMNQVSLYSNSLGENRLIDIYLPEGYNPNDIINYPVIYFLHGGGGFNDYSLIKSILDDLISSGTIMPVILVAPDGTVDPYILSCYANSELNGNYEDFAVIDLINFIDSEYKTIPSREKRSIMGHSWGAYSCMKLALKHPDIFGAVASHSGTLDLTQTLLVRRSGVLAENGGSPPYNFNPDAGPLTFGIFAWSAAFSPNLNNQPYLVDFPIDRFGDIIDSVMSRWYQHDPSELAESLSLDTGLEIFFDCGTSDELGNYEVNLAFADSLNFLGISYEFQAYSGGHSDQLQSRFPVSLAFLNSAMITSVKRSSIIRNLERYVLYQNYPNPFNPNTKIKYTISRESKVRIRVFDILGNEIISLINEEKPAGSYEVEFKAYGLPSGIYLYQLLAGKYSATKKMILLK